MICIDTLKRLLNLSEIMYTESRIRTIVKTLSWRLTATVSTIIIVFILTKNFKLAASIGGIEVFVKLLIYYVHERVWGKINIGKKIF